MMLVLLLLLNVAISFWNARVVGMLWPERNVSGGFMKLVIWSAAIQSVIGFSMPLILGEVYIAHALGLISAKIVAGTLSLWYIAVIVPLLGTGTIITIHSWIIAYRERNFLNMGIAAYNTVTMAHNIYSASSGIGNALGKIGEVFEGEDSGKIAIALAFVFLALIGGFLITRAIILHYAGKLPLPERQTVNA